MYLSLFVRTMPGIVVKKTVTISCKPMQQFHGQMHFLKNEMDRWQEGNFKVFLIADGKERMQKYSPFFKIMIWKLTLSGRSIVSRGCSHN